MARITERSCTHLTDWQIADAFPDECKTYYRLRFMIAKAKLQLFFWNIEEIQEEYPDDFLRNFFIDMNWLFMPKDVREEYRRMDKILNICKMKKKAKRDGRVELNIDLAKSVPIEGLYGFEKLRRQRKQLLAICPFHNEKTPSFYIYLNDNKYHCYGCGAHGDVIDFVMKLKGIGFVEAVRYLLGL